MNKAVVTLIIIAVLIVFYIIEKFPAAIACCIGASLAFAMPVATTTVTMVQVAGYRFKDYFRIGGIVGAIGVAVSWISLVLIYRL